jgi:hypothetical protein
MAATLVLRQRSPVFLVEDRVEFHVRHRHARGEFSRQGGFP